MIPLHLERVFLLQVVNMLDHHRMSGLGESQIITVNPLVLLVSSNILTKTWLPWAS